MTTNPKRQYLTKGKLASYGAIIIYIIVMKVNYDLLMNKDESLSFFFVMVGVFAFLIGCIPLTVVSDSSHVRIWD